MYLRLNLFCQETIVGKRGGGEIQREKRREREREGEGERGRRDREGERERIVLLSEATRILVLFCLLGEACHPHYTVKARYRLTTLQSSNITKRINAVPDVGLRGVRHFSHCIYIPQK